MSDDVKNNSKPNSNACCTSNDEQANLDNKCEQTELLAITIERLETELKEAKSKADENWNSLLRAKAEIENVRRRSALDLEKAHKFSVESFARDLLHVVDSLDKGLEVSYTTGDASQVEAMLQGLQLTHKLLVDTLDKFGIKEINPIGELFDPSKHEALSMQENNNVEPNSILMVVQKGFTIYERILRPARVIVAKPTTASSMPRIDEKA